MFETLSIKNFKAFSGWQDIKLAPITLIYGPNSSGKSSIIHSIMLLKQSITRPSIQGGLVANGDYVELGDYASMIHRHDVKGIMSFRFSYMPVKKQNYSDFAIFSAFGTSHRRHYHLEYSFSEDVANHNGFSYLSSMAVSVRSESGEGEIFSTSLNSELAGRNDYDQSSRLVAAKRYKFSDNTAWHSAKNYLDRRLRAGTKPIDIDRMLDGASFLSDLNYSTPSLVMSEAKLKADSSFQSQIILNAALSDLAKELKEKFNSITYLGPLRSHPSRFYAPKVDQSDSVGKQGEFIAKYLYESPGIVERINGWFKSFEVPYKLETVNLGTPVTGPVISLQLEDQRTHVKVGPSDVGFGIGQMLPIIVEGTVRTDSVICVEQPEIHLHPRLQAHLANFFVETCENNQWIIETHSESLILRLQSMIERKLVSPNKISIIYVEPTSKGGEVIPIRLDRDGDFIDAWPEGFFEERLKEKLGING